MSKILAAALVLAFLDTAEAGRGISPPNPCQSILALPSCRQKSANQNIGSAGLLFNNQAARRQERPAIQNPVAPQGGLFSGFQSGFSFQPQPAIFNLPAIFGGSQSSTLGSATDSVVNAPPITVYGKPGQDISVIAAPTFSLGGSSTLFNAGSAVAKGADVTAIGADGLIGANAFAKGSDAISLGGSTTLGLPGNSEAYGGKGTAKGGSGILQAGNGTGVGGDSFAAPGVGTIASNLNAQNAVNSIPGFGALIQSLTSSPCGHKC